MDALDWHKNPFQLFQSCLGVILFLGVIGSPGARGEQVVREALESAALHLQSGHPESALTQLQKIETLEPGNPWLYYYKGVARTQQGRPREALGCLEKAEELLRASGVDDTDFLHRIQSSAATVRRELLEFTLAIGLAYDSNVTFSGNASSARLISGREDGKFSTLLGADAWLAGEGDTRLTAGLHAAQSWQFLLESFDEQTFGGYIQLQHDLNDRWSLTSRFDHDFTLLGHDSFLSDYEWTNGWTFRPSRTDGAVQFSQTGIYYRLTVQDFLQKTTAYFDQDATSQALGLNQGFLLRPIGGQDWTWKLSAGYEIENVEAQGPEYDRLEQAAHLGAIVPLVKPSSPDDYLLLPDKELSLGVALNWRIENYRNESRIDFSNNRRRDNIFSLEMALSQTLRDDPEQGRLVVHVIGAFSRADSNVRLNDNASPFTYEKYFFGVQLQWSF